MRISIQTQHTALFITKSTKPYNSQVGIKQGDNLSTLLFNIYLNDIPQYLNKQSNDPIHINDIPQYFNKQSNDPIHINDSTMHTMMFVDDLLLLPTSASKLQNSIVTLCEYCAEWKLNINILPTSASKLQNSIDTLCEYCAEWKLNINILSTSASITT